MHFSAWDTDHEPISYSIVPFQEPDRETRQLAYMALSYARMYASRPYRECVELQQLLMANARQPELKALILCGIARAFCELEECKRKLKMRPLPKPVDVTLPLKRARVALRDAPSFTESA